MYDIFIIGGGINGAGIARDAAGRGFKTKLVEKNDLASATSSQSSKLIHGGLRYLEHFEFRLVREAISEREILLRAAPHIIWPMRFVLPHNKNMRAKWMLRLGLFIYDNIGKRKILEKTKYLNLKKEQVGKALKENFKSGFEYSDCWVDDARLVVLNAMDAKNKGAEIETQTEFVSANQKAGGWQIKTRNNKTGEVQMCESKLIINAAGPWVDEIINKTVEDKNKKNTKKNIRLVKGSHIVVPKIFNHDRAYIFQHEDERVIFAIPYENNYSLIGTSDADYTGDLESIKINNSEVKYFCDVANNYFKKQINETDIVHSFAGVRPLYDDGATSAQEATRDYVVKVKGNLINIFGGKITTYRKLAETILESAEKIIGKKGGKWTAKAKLPGGNFAVNDFEKLVGEVQSKHNFLTKSHATRLARCYGTNVWQVLAGMQTEKAMGKNFGGTLTECEVEYLIKKEWAKTANDIIWRRTKTGIHMKKSQIAELENWLTKYFTHN